MGGICYDNILRSGTIISENTIADFRAANAYDGKTSSQMGVTAGGDRDLIIDNGSAVEIDTLCFARHTLGASGGSIQVAGSTNNSSYTTLFTVNPADDNVTFSAQSSYTYRYYRIRVTGHSHNTYFADIFLGKRLDLQRSQKHGFIKPEFADGDQIISNITRGGNLAGLSVKTGVKRAQFDLFYYTASFFTEWADLVSTMKQYPIYIVWDSSNAQLPFYCWPTKNIPQPKYSRSINGYYTVKMDMSGITA